MAVMVLACPHCGAERMTFGVTAAYPYAGNFASHVAIGHCGNCKEPVIASLQMPQNSKANLEHFQGDLLGTRELAVRNIWPKAPAIDAPQHLPEKIARAFVEAATARRVQLWNAACSSYRRCLELTLKQFAPDVAAPTLVKRIDKLAADHRITPDLKDWAHELRLDGNEAVHGDEEATQEITDQMHHLTYFLLTYLYTLPKQVEDESPRLY